ncbi:MAG: porin family protein [Pseudaminobacter sp.]
MRLAASIVALLLSGAVATAAAPDRHQAETLFKTGMAAAKQGRHDRAVETYEALLQVSPTPRIKLELARSLFAVGQYDKSLALFRSVYEEPGTPQTVKRNILPFMEEAELRSLRVRYGVRAITDTNPSRVADGGTIFFNGVPLEFQPPAPKDVAYGVEPWLSVEKLWQNGLLTKFYGSARLFENENLLAGRFQFAVARRIPSVPGLFFQAALDGEISRDNAYVLPSIETWKRFRLSDTAGIGLGGQIGYMTAENSDVSGGFYRPYLFGDWTFLPNATAFARMAVEHLNSRNDYYTYIAPKIDFGLALKAGGFNAMPQLTVTHTKFTQHDAFWGLNRKDTMVRPTLTVSHDRMEWKGIKPELSVFYEERNSNVGIYDYSQFGGFVNFRKLY